MDDERGGGAEMTALETWLVEMVKVAVGDVPLTANTQTDKDSAEDFRLLEQRTAILLVQARAIECRHLAGELAIKYGTGAGLIIQGLWDRSHKLEAIGLMLSQQWPPVDGNEVMICQCKVDSGESAIVTGTLGRPDLERTTEFVCATCKLPKHGKAGNGPVLVTQ